MDGNQVTLQWTEVDGEKVALGSMKKTVCIGSDGLLAIDTFRYAKN